MNSQPFAFCCQSKRQMAGASAHVVISEQHEPFPTPEESRRKSSRRFGVTEGYVGQIESIFGSVPDLDPVVSVTLAVDRRPVVSGHHLVDDQADHRRAPVVWLVEPREDRISVGARRQRDVDGRYRQQPEERSAQHIGSLPLGRPRSRVGSWGLTPTGSGSIKRTELVLFLAMLRISRISDYAIRLLAEVATQSGRQFTARQAAAQVALPHPVVSKILKSLAKKGVLVSERGVQGGYRLTRDPERIPLLEIIFAVEGRLSLTDCDPTREAGSEGCRHEAECTIRHGWAKVNKAVVDALAGINLGDMVCTPERRLVQLGTRMDRTRSVSRGATFLTTE